MTNWIQVVANSNLIQTSTENAVLIKLPKSDHQFWHPKKCVRTSGKNGYRLSISFTDSFVFKCFKNGQGKHNFKEVISSFELSAAEFQGYFA